MVFSLFQDKLTESNYTLGALSPESAELIGQLDPVLGSIAAPRQPETIATSLGVSINPEEELENESEEDLLRSTDLDLGFYFGSSSSNSNCDEEDQEANVDSLSEQLEASLEDMIQTAQMHPRSLQVRREIWNVDAKYGACVGSVGGNLRMLTYSSLRERDPFLCAYVSGTREAGPRGSCVNIPFSKKKKKKAGPRAAY